MAFSKARLERVHEVLAGYVDRGDLPGFVSLVSRGDEIHVDAMGTLAVDGDATMRRDSIFRISSLTKPMTAAATMLLIEDCELRLDDPVDRWLPELANRRVLRRLDGPVDGTVPAVRPITVRDLLTFTSGYGLVMAEPGSTPIQVAMDELQLGQGAPSPQVAPEPDEWIQRLGTLPLLHQPGEQWAYNTASDVLGVLIARASGQPFEVFLRERLFEPLGMRDTGFAVPTEAIDRLATSYATNPETNALTLNDEPYGQWSRPPAFPSGAGGLVATIDDCFAFGAMMLHSGRHDRDQVLSPASVSLMTADHLSPAQKASSAFVPGFWDARGWGFGVSVVTKRTDLASTVGKFGWDGGLGTTWSSDPRYDMVSILMTQCAWTSPNPPNVCRDFWTAAYQAIDD
jgi:CubicO group peptidase (beta-lactamase class C family)